MTGFRIRALLLIGQFSYPSFDLETTRSHIVRKVVFKSSVDNSQCTYLGRKHALKHRLKC
jgi:hypothetical protein